jgi:Xaa-Pro aminopeptidase
MLKLALPFLMFIPLALPAAGPPWTLPPLRSQAELQQEWLNARLETHLPQLMRKHGVAMWLIICREYNEDPVFFSLVSPATMAARRRTILLFHDRGPAEGVERLALGGGSNGGLYTVYRDPENPGREIMGDAQWATLRKLIEQRRPATIALDISHTHAFADGLSAGEYQQLETALGPEWMRRAVRAENLAVEFVSLRAPGMLPIFRGMTEVVHWLLARAFSREVISPGKTTNQDIVWWLRQQAQDLGYSTWFHTTVRVQKPAAAGVSLLAEDTPAVIERGDVLHADFGLTAMRMNTDTQHMGYVLREGETGPPPGIVKALANAQRMQDLHLERMKPGLTGNQVLAATLDAAKREGIRGAVYSHPVGDHGHGAGPLIGLWDRQEGVPGKGDLVLLPGTWFSIELNARTPVPEWGGKELWVGMEEDAVLTPEGAHWVLRRQEKFHLVR